MSYTSPRTWVAGEIVTASNLNTHLRDNLLELNGTTSAWQSWTPQVDQGVTTNIAKTVAYGKFKQSGKTVRASFRLNIVGTGTAGSNIVVNVPVAALVGSSQAVGAGGVTDTSASTVYNSHILLPSVGSIVFVTDGSTAGAVGTAPSFALAANDVLTGSIEYEAA